MRREHAQADGMGSFPPRWRALLAVCALALAVFLVAGCGSDNSSSSSTEADTAASTPSSGSSGGGSATPTSGDKVDIANFDYAPKALQVGTGTKVTFTNSDSATHTATAKDGSFDTGDLDKGDSKAITFDKPGTYAYYCRFHAFMKATVTVK